MHASLLLIISITISAISAISANEIPLHRVSTDSSYRMVDFQSGIVRNDFQGRLHDGEKVVYSYQARIPETLSIYFVDDDDNVKVVSCLQDGLHIEFESLLLARNTLASFEKNTTLIIGNSFDRTNWKTCELIQYVALEWTWVAGTKVHILARNANYNEFFSEFDLEYNVKLRPSELREGRYIIDLPWAYNLNSNLDIVEEEDVLIDSPEASLTCLDCYLDSDLYFEFHLGWNDWWVKVYGGLGFEFNLQLTLDGTFAYQFPLVSILRHSAPPLYVCLDERCRHFVATPRLSYGVGVEARVETDVLLSVEYSVIGYGMGSYMMSSSGASYDWDDFYFSQTNPAVDPEYVALRFGPGIVADVSVLGIGSTFSGWVLGEFELTPTERTFEEIPYSVNLLTRLTWNVDLFLGSWDGEEEERIHLWDGALAVPDWVDLQFDLGRTRKVEELSSQQVVGYISTTGEVLSYEVQPNVLSPSVFTLVPVSADVCSASRSQGRPAQGGHRAFTSDSPAVAASLGSQEESRADGILFSSEGSSAIREDHGPQPKSEHREVSLLNPLTTPEDEPIEAQLEATLDTDPIMEATGISFTTDWPLVSSSFVSSVFDGLGDAFSAWIGALQSTNSSSAAVSSNLSSPSANRDSDIHNGGFSPAKEAGVLGGADASDGYMRSHCYDEYSPFSCDPNYYLKEDYWTYDVCCVGCESSSDCDDSRYCSGGYCKCKSMYEGATATTHSTAADECDLTSSCYEDYVLGCDANYYDADPGGYTYDICCVGCESSSDCDQTRYCSGGYCTCREWYEGPVASSIWYTDECSLSSDCYDGWSCDEDHYAVWPGWASNYCCPGCGTVSDCEDPNVTGCDEDHLCVCSSGYDFNAATNRCEDRETGCYDTPEEIGGCPDGSYEIQSRAASGSALSEDSAWSRWFGNSERCCPYFACGDPCGAFARCSSSSCVCQGDTFFDPDVEACAPRSQSLALKYGTVEITLSSCDSSSTHRVTVSSSSSSPTSSPIEVAATFGEAPTTRYFSLDPGSYVLTPDPAACVLGHVKKDDDTLAEVDGSQPVYFIVPSVCYALEADVSNIPGDLFVDGVVVDEVSVSVVDSTFVSKTFHVTAHVFEVADDNSATVDDTSLD
eukprot:Rmarinus@m.12773